MKKYILFLFVLVFSLGLFNINFNSASASVSGCVAGDNFSRTTGQPCSGNAPTACAPGDLFSSVTGLSCGGVIFPPGCSSTSGYSVTTGARCDGTTTPSITVLSPNGGEELVLRSTTPIRWKMSGNLYPYVSVYLQPEGSDTVYLIPGSDKTTDSFRLVSSGVGMYGFDWYVDDVGISNIAGKYRVLVQNHSGTEGSPDAKDYSNSSFAIVSTFPPGCNSSSRFSVTTGARCDGTTTPSITVLSPNGGESYKAGDEVNFTWQANGFSSNDSFGLIVYNYPSKTIALFSVASLNIGTRTYKWTVPAGTNSGQYVAYVVSNSTGYSDLGNSYFTITAPPATVTNPTITVAAPNISSGGASMFVWVIPKDAVSAKLYISCPSGVSAKHTGINGTPLNASREECNRWTDIPVSFSADTETGREFTFTNNTSTTQNVVPNFYIYHASSPNLAVGVSSSITVNPATTSIQPSITSSPTATVSLTSSNENKAGTSEVFAPGSYGSNPNDWKWTLNLAMNGNTKTISSMEISGSGATQGDIWTTHTSHWPIVVFKNGQQLNTRKGQTFSVGPNMETLYLYGQQSAKTTWGGGTLTIAFTDGTAINAAIPASTTSALGRISAGSLTANAINGMNNSNASAAENAAIPESFHFKQFLEEGSYGNEVRNLQKFLNRAGYDVGKVDGVFGAKVKAALIEFQISNKLKGDGIVGYEVRSFMNR